jgi:hypothetical protein
MGWLLNHQDLAASLISGILVSGFHTWIARTKKVEANDPYAALWSLVVKVVCKTGSTPGSALEQTAEDDRASAPEGGAAMQEINKQMGGK